MVTSTPTSGGSAPHPPPTVADETRQSLSDTILMLRSLIAAVEPLADLYGQIDIGQRYRTNAKVSIPVDMLFDLDITRRAVCDVMTGRMELEKAYAWMAEINPHTHTFSVGDEVMYRGVLVTITRADAHTRLTKEPAYNVLFPGGFAQKGVREGDLRKPPPDKKQGELSTGGSGHSPKSSANTEASVTVPPPSFSPTGHNAPQDEGGRAASGWHGPSTPANRRAMPRHWHRR